MTSPRRDDLRRQRDLKGATAIYASLAKRGAMTADSWADYADATASMNGGKLSGDPARYIDQALGQDPRHIKALWLKASLAYQEKRYADAVKGWAALRDALPEGSPDQNMIAANLAESARLAGIPEPAAATGAATPSPAVAGKARISGSVELAPKLRDRAGAGDTLYIYAREIGASGPPLAVLRVTADRWPVSFTLDDSNAMIPGRDLSHADIVLVEARISRSGNAIPQSGDLVGTIDVRRPALPASRFAIAIDRVF